MESLCSRQEQQRKRTVPFQEVLGMRMYCHTNGTPMVLCIRVRLAASGPGLEYRSGWAVRDWPILKCVGMVGAILVPQVVRLGGWLRHVSL